MLSLLGQQALIRTMTVASVLAHSWDKCVLHGREGSGREGGARDMGKLSLPHSFVAIWNLQ